MAEVASAYVTLLPSAKGFAAGIQGQIGGDLTRAGRKGGTDYGTGMKAGVAGIATKVFAPLAVAAAGLGLGKILGDSVTAGSDFEQALGGADAVFKKDAAGIKKSASDAAKDLALPKTAYLKLATVLGAGLKNKGLKDVAGQTKNLISLGGDLAAQYGGSTQDAVAAISSLMRGEADPIEKYGVGINETAVNAELARKGLKGLTGSALDQAKAQARVDLLFKQSKDAMGAASREAGTYAGVNGRLSASWEDIKTGIGSALLPGLTDLSSWFFTKGLPAVKEFGGWVKDELWPALKDGYETIRPGLERAQDIILGAFGGDSKDAMKTFGDVITQKIIPAVATFTNVYLPVLATNLRTIIEVVKTIYATFEFWRTVVEKVTTFIIDAFVKVTGFAADMLDGLSVVPGFGWAKDAADKLRGVSEQAAAVKEAINGIPRERRIKIIADVSMPGRITLPTGDKVNVGLRAKGGPVKAGSPYVVGERGPELIVPRYNAHVLTNEESFGAASARGGAAIDYYRLGAAVASELRGVALEVGVRETGQAITRHQNQRQQY